MTHACGPGEPDPAPDVGRIIAGKYQIVRRVGRGGMGTVYEARHRFTEHRFALKLLDPLVARDATAVARFRREAKAAATLRHQGCVEVFDYGQDDGGTFFLVMEFIEGRTLEEEVARQGPLPASRVAHIGEQLLAALEHAHRHGVLHRDIKPQNIMLTQKFGWPDHVKVVDFGIAQWRDPADASQAALTVPGTLFGTPEFMSPEQARGEVLDARSDVYAAGAVLWFLLLGRSPFRGGSARETLTLVLQGAPPLPSQERPGEVPVELEGILLRALAKDAARRYTSASSLRNLLGAFRDLASGPPDEPAALDGGLALPDLAPSRQDDPHAAGDSPAAACDPPDAHAPTPGTGEAAVQLGARVRARRLLPVVVLLLAVLSAGFALGLMWDAPSASRQPPSAAGALGSGASATVPAAGDPSAGASSAREVLPAGAAPDGERPEDQAARRAGSAAWESATLALHAGDLAAAQVALAEVLARDPKDARAHANLATLYFRQGQHELARAHMARAAELDPRYARQLASLREADAAASPVSVSPAVMSPAIMSPASVSPASVSPASVSPSGEDAPPP